MEAQVAIRRSPIASLTAVALAVLLGAGAASVAGSERGSPQKRLATADPVGAEEWMYMQRANADGSIPASAVLEGIAQSQVMGAVSKGTPSTNQIWAPLGPSNIGGRVRDIAADPSARDVVYIATGSGGLW